MLECQFARTNKSRRSGRRHGNPKLPQIVASERNARVHVLNNPTMAPMRPDQADLFGHGPGPGRGRLRHGKTTHRDVVSPSLVRIEDTLTHIDFHGLFIGIGTLELCPDRGRLFIYLRIPEWSRPHGRQHCLQRRGFIQPITVEIDDASMTVKSIPGCVIPLSPDDIFVGIEIAKETVGQRHFPHGALHLLPPLDHLRPLDRHPLAGCRLIDNPFCIRRPAAWWVDTLTIHTHMHGNHITRQSHRRRCGDCLEGV